MNVVLATYTCTDECQGMASVSFDSLCDKVREQLQRNARVRYVVAIELLWQCG